MGAIMLDFQWNSMKAVNGFAELGKPMYERKMWSADFLGMEPPTMRGIVDMAMQIVGTFVGGPLGSTLLGFVDDLLFAGLDIAGGYKDPGQVASDLAKKALVAAVSAGAGALGEGLGKLAGNLSGAAKVFADVGTSALTGVLSTVTNTAIGAMDFTQIGKGGFFNTEQFTSSMSSMDTWASTVSSVASVGLTGGLGLMNLRDGDKVALNGGFFDREGIGNLNSFVGSLAGSAVTYGMTGNVTFNLARINGKAAKPGGAIRSTGLFEMSFGKDGFSTRFGMGGTDISYGTVANAMKGASEAAKVASWKYGGKESRANLNVVNQSSYIGDEFHMGLASDIWEGRLNVDYKEMDDAYGLFEVGGNTITISDSLLGGGQEGTAKLASVIAHEGTHAYGNRVEGLADAQAGNTYGALNAMFGLEGDKNFEGQILAGIANPENAKENTGDTDFWKFVDGGWQDDGREDFYIDAFGGGELMMTAEDMKALANREQSILNGNGVLESGSDDKNDGFKQALFNLVAKDHPGQNIGIYNDYARFAAKSGAFADVSIEKDRLIGTIENLDANKTATIPENLFGNLNTLLKGLQSSDILIKHDPTSHDDKVETLPGSGLYSPVASENMYITSLPGWRVSIFGEGNDTHSGLDGGNIGGKNLVAAADESTVSLGYDYTFGLEVSNGFSYDSKAFVNQLAHAEIASTLNAFVKLATTKGVGFDASGSKLTGVVGGATIGTVGSSGESTAAHVHWRLWDVNDSESSSYPTAHDLYAPYIANLKHKNSAVYRESGYANNATSEDMFRRYTESLRMENLGTIQYALPGTSKSNEDALWSFIFENGIY